MALKPCSKCKILKDLSNFAKRSNRKSGYSSSCKKCNKLYQKEFYKKPGIKERIIENKRKLRKNPDFRKKEYAYSIKYQAKRRKEDSLFKLANNLRTRLGNFIRRNSINKKCGTLILLGCSLTKLKIHLESKFIEGMTWENQGKWHIDHIIPLSSAKTEEELYKLCHYTNLQPLWALDNIKKGAKHAA